MKCDTLFNKRRSAVAGNNLPNMINQNASQLAYCFRMAAKDAAYDTFGRDRGLYEKSPGEGREKSLAEGVVGGGGLCTSSDWEVSS